MTLLFLVATTLCSIALRAQVRTSYFCESRAQRDSHKNNSHGSKRVALYVAEALLDQEGLSFSSHAAVISAFGQYLVRPGKVPLQLHRQLIDAQAQRTRADYDVSSNLSQSDAEEIVDQAQAFLSIALQNLA
jgi:HEPN domain